MTRDEPVGAAPAPGADPAGGGSGGNRGALPVATLAFVVCLSVNGGVVI